MRLFLCAIVLFLSACFPAFSQVEAITESNWVNHTSIKEVREIVNTIHSDIKEGVLKREQKFFEYCSPNHDTMRMTYGDKKGKVRQYIFSGGTEDSAADFIHYYDEAGTVRFVLKKAAASNGTEIEARFYFDAKGKKIWTNLKTFKGPGWPGAGELSDDVVVRDPKKAFVVDNKCK